MIAFRVVLCLLATSCCQAFSPLQAQPRHSPTTLAVAMGNDFATLSRDAVEEAVSAPTVSEDRVLSWDWESLAVEVLNDVRESTNGKGAIVLFDGVCNFCNGGVNFCIDWDKDCCLQFASLQSKIGQSLMVRAGKSPDDLSSIVFVDPTTGETFFESDAVLRIGGALSGFPRPVRGACDMTRWFIPGMVRNAVYHLVAEHRHLFGASEGPVCRIDWDGTLNQRFLVDPTDEGDETHGAIA